MSDAAFVVKNALVVNTNLLVVANNKIGILTSTPNATLTVNGSANISGNVTLAGSNVSVLANTQIIASNISLQANATANTLVISANSTAVNVSINASNFNVNTQFNVTGIQFVSGNVGLGSNTFFVNQTTNRVGINNTAPDASLSITGTANISGNVTLNGANLNVGSNTLFVSPNFAVKSNTSISVLTISSNGTAVNTSLGGDNLIVNSNTTFNGNIYTVNSAAVNLTGNIALKSNSSVTGFSLTGNSSATNTSILSTTISLTGTTSVIGNTSLTGNLNVTGISTLTGNATITGSSLAFKSNSSITAILVTGNSTATNTSINGDTFYINSGNSYFGGTNVNMTGNVNVTGSSHVFLGNTAFGNNSLIVDSTDRRIGINTPTPDATLSVNGTANVSGVLRVGGDLIVGGNLTYTGVSTADIIPVGNSYNLGNSTNQWTLYAVTATVSNTLSVAANAFFGANTLIVDTVNKRVGVGGISNPANTLSVNGQIQSILGGFRFPDNTVQTTAGLTIAGSNTNVLFNNSNILAGSNGLNFDQTSNTLTVSNTLNTQILSLANGNSATPSILFPGSQVGLYLSSSNAVSYSSSGLIRWTFNNGRFISAQAPVQTSDLTPNFQVIGIDGDSSSAAILNYSNTITKSNTSVLVFGKSISNTKGTIGASPLADNTSIGTIEFMSANGTTFVNSAFIDVRSEGTAAASVGGKITFWTANASVAPSQKMSIAANGNIGIGTDAAANTLSVNGTFSVSGNAIHGGTIFANATDSVTAPGFTWAGNTTTGFYRAGTDQIGIAITGTQRVLANSTIFTVNAAANVVSTFQVGGNTSLGGTLSVTGNTTLAGNASLTGTLQTFSGNSNFASGTFFVDNTNHRVGVNNTTPTAALTVSGDILGTANVTAVNMTLSGNLIVSGTTTTINTASLNVSDNIITLNSDVTGAPTENSGFEINRGTSANVSLLWNETTKAWTLTPDGTNFYSILYNGFSGALLNGNTALDTTTMFIDATNHRVGIGNTTPDAKLSVTGSANISGNMNLGGTLNVGGNTTILASNIAFYSNSSVRGYSFSSNGTATQTWLFSDAITTTANTIGLNANSVSIWAPALTLNAVSTFTGNALFSVANSNTLVVDVVGNRVSMNAPLTVTGTANVTGNTVLGQTLDVTGNVFFHSTGLHTISGNVNFNTNTLFVDSTNSRVGIGTNAPNTFLTVNGDTFINGNSTITGQLSAGSLFLTSGVISSTLIVYGTGTFQSSLSVTGISTLSNNVSVGQNLSVVGNLSVTGINSTIGGNVSLGTSTLFIDGTNDRIGINNTTPTVSLYVGGTDAIFLPNGTTAQRPTGANGMIRYNSNSASFEGFANGGWGAIGGSLSIAGSNTQVQFNDSGNLGATANLTFDKTTGTLTAGSFNTISDYRLKENLNPLADSLDRVSRMAVYSYNMVDDRYDEREGVLAHELQKIVPFAVHGIKDHEEIYQSVDYSRIVPVLIGSIKELNEKIRHLESLIRKDI